MLAIIFAHRLNTMRLTAETISGADQTLNPSNELTLVLRGQRVALIENLGVTRDQYECIDLSDNDIIKVSGFPRLSRLRTLLLANNQVSRIADDAFTDISGITSLVLSNNKISRLSTLVPISGIRKLERLSLINNPVSREPRYRFFVLHLLQYAESFRFLDFQKVTHEERQQARAYFQSEEGKAILSNLLPEVNVEDTTPQATSQPARRYALSQDVLERIKLALTEAEDMDIVNKLERTLKTGEITDDVAKIIGLE